MRKLGQHFLKNRSAIKNIIDALEIKSGDTIVEIGAGHGELTTELRTENVELRILAIERDKKLADELERKVKERGETNVEIICDDALKFIKSIPKSYLLSPQSYKIVGNIPYYITGRLLRILSELEHKPEICVFTIQKEVAERITSKPPRMNRLAAIVQFWAEPKILKILSPEDFGPRPKVESAIVRLRIQNLESRIKDSDYYRTVKMLFAQPRKTILSNLATRDMGHGTWTKNDIQEKLRGIGIDPSDRPQNLSVAQICTLTEALRGSDFFEEK